jgi:hypothetical protein
MMHFYKLILIVVCCLSLSCIASADQPFVTQEPVCFKIINTASYNIRGSVSTDEFPMSNGVMTRHRSNFSLNAGKTMEACSSGPFFEGQRLQIDLRTLVPIFSCKTGLWDDVKIRGFVKKDGTAETWIECL